MVRVRFAPGPTGLLHVGKQLFHPLRAALTAASSGPELDKLIPLIETAAQLKIKGILSCKERVAAFLHRYG